MKHASTFPILESLEPRLAPAGVVAISTAGGVLTITGDAGVTSNSIQISDGGNGLWHISDHQGDGTTFSLNGAPAVAALDITAAAKGIKVQLGEGDDFFRLNNVTVVGPLTIADKAGDDTFNLDFNSINGAIKIDTGAGNDQILFNNNQLNGAITAKMGAGDDTFDLSSGLYRHVTADLGTGSNSLDIDSSRITLLGNLNVTTAGGGSETQDFLLAAANGLITGSVKFIVKAGDSKVTFGSLNGDDMRILGSVTIQTAAGNDDVTLKESVFVGGNFTYQSGAGDDFLRLIENVSTGGLLTMKSTDGENVLLGDNVTSLSLGGLTMVGGKGNDQIVLGGNHISIAGNVSMSAGTGDQSSVSFLTLGTLEIGGNLTYKGGTGDDNLSITNGKTHLLGTLNFTGSNGTNAMLVVPEVGLFGSINFTGGTGSEFIELGDSSDNTTLISVFGKTSMNLGKGLAQISIRDTLFNSTLTIATAGDQDQMEMTESTIIGAFNLKSTGQANGTLDIEGSTFHSLVSLYTGAGDDTLNFDTTLNTPARNTFLGAVKINLGDGDDTLSGGKNPIDVKAGNTFQSLLTVDGGKGNDVVSLRSDFNNVFDIVPDIKDTVETAN